MKKYLIALSLCLALALPAFAADDGALKQTIENRYSDMRIAIKSGNPARYREILAADYSSIDLNGVARNADQIIAAIGDTLPDDSRKESTTVTSMKQDGDKAVVEQTYDMTALRLVQDDKKITYHMVTKSTDTWVKDKDTWKLQKTVANVGDIFVNDAPVGHRVRGEAVTPVAGAADKPGDKKPDNKANVAPAK